MAKYGMTIGAARGRKMREIYETVDNIFSWKISIGFSTQESRVARVVCVRSHLLFAVRQIDSNFIKNLFDTQLFRLLVE